MIKFKLTLSLLFEITRSILKRLPCMVVDCCRQLNSMFFSSIVTTLLAGSLPCLSIKHAIHPDILFKVAALAITHFLFLFQSGMVTA